MLSFVIFIFGKSAMKSARALNQNFLLLAVMIKTVYVIVCDWLDLSDMESCVCVLDVCARVCVCFWFMHVYSPWDVSR